MRVLKVTEPNTPKPMMFVQLGNDEGYTLEVGAYGGQKSRLKAVATAVGAVSQHFERY